MNGFNETPSTVVAAGEQLVTASHPCDKFYLRYLVRLSHHLHSPTVSPLLLNVVSYN